MPLPDDGYRGYTILFEKSPNVPAVFWTDVHWQFSVACPGVRDQVADIVPAERGMYVVGVTIGQTCNISFVPTVRAIPLANQLTVNGVALPFSSVFTTTHTFTAEGRLLTIRVIGLLDTTTSIPTTTTATTTTTTTTTPAPTVPTVQVAITYAHGPQVSDSQVWTLTFTCPTRTVVVERPLSALVATAEVDQGRCGIRVTTPTNPRPYMFGVKLNGVGLPYDFDSDRGTTGNFTPFSVLTLQVA